MRDLIVIADKIIDVIQENCTWDDEKINEIVSQIKDVKSSHMYRAPELENVGWWEISDILCDNFNPNNSEWEKKIQIIFNDLD